MSTPDQTQAPTEAAIDRGAERTAVVNPPEFSLTGSQPSTNLQIIRELNSEHSSVPKEFGGLALVDGRQSLSFEPERAEAGSAVRIASGFDTKARPPERYGRGEQPGDNSTRYAQSEVLPSSDAQPRTGLPQTERDPVGELAKDTAGKLAAAAGNPELMQKIFREAVTSFSSQNPTESAQDLARALQSALREQPGNHGLEVHFYGHDGRREGSLTLSLLQRQADGSTKEISEQDHSFLRPVAANEHEPLAQRLIEGSVLQGERALDAAKDIVATASQMVMETRYGQDPNATFDQSAAAFNAKYPNIDPAIYARMLQGALRLNPIPTNLQVGFRDSEGSDQTAVRLYTVDGRMQTTLSETPMRYRR